MTVYKYLLGVNDMVTLDLPQGAEPLHVDVQGGRVWLWARVDPSQPEVPRVFRIAGTGHDLGPANNAPHVGTVLLHDGRLVFHVFELGEQST